MLLSEKPPFATSQYCVSESSIKNIANPNFPKSRKIFFHFPVKLALASLVFISIGFAGILTFEKLAQSEVAIASNGKCGCSHPHVCFPCPD